MVHSRAMVWCDTRAGAPVQFLQDWPPPQMPVISSRTRPTWFPYCCVIAVIVTTLTTGHRFSCAYEYLLYRHWFSLCVTATKATHMMMTAELCQKRGISFASARAPSCWVGVSWNLVEMAVFLDAYICFFYVHVLHVCTQRHTQYIHIHTCMFVCSTRRIAKYGCTPGDGKKAVPVTLWLKRGLSEAACKRCTTA